MGHARLLLRVFLFAVLIIAAAPTAAGAQGNSAAAQACQKGGYAELVGAGGETFANPGECTSFAAQGGVFADGTILIPAGWSVTITDQVLLGCNALSFGYTLNGGAEVGLGAKPYHCDQPYAFDDVVVGPVGETTVLVVSLHDLSCAQTYDSNGNHARLVANAPVYDVDITDTGGFCEEGPGVDRFPLDGGDGNLSLTVIVHP